MLCVFDRVSEVFDSLLAFEDKKQPCSSFCVCAFSEPPGATSPIIFGSVQKAIVCRNHKLSDHLILHLHCLLHSVMRASSVFSSFLLTRIISFLRWKFFNAQVFIIMMQVLKKLTFPVALCTYIPSLFQTEPRSASFYFLCLIFIHFKLSVTLIHIIVFLSQIIHLLLCLSLTQQGSKYWSRSKS